MSVAVSVGSRLPAFHTSMGRAQLGFLDEAELWRRLKSVRIEPLTPSTITDLQALFDRIRDDHAQGFSIVDEELERGLRSIAVTVVDRQNQAVGALNLETHATRTTRNEMRDRFLPELRAVAAQIAPWGSAQLNHPVWIVLVPLTHRGDRVMIKPVLVLRDDRTAMRDPLRSRKFYSSQH
jgi:DNA-binding IclR family transcriptional regulator